eukprot:259921_1
MARPSPENHTNQTSQRWQLINTLLDEGFNFQDASLAYRTVGNDPQKAKDWLTSRTNPPNNVVNPQNNKSNNVTEPQIRNDVIHSVNDDNETLSTEEVKAEYKSNYTKPNTSRTASEHPICVCGNALKKYQVQYAYINVNSVQCNLCQTHPNDAQELMYHCPTNRTPQHPNGYDLCLICAQKQIDDPQGFKTAQTQVIHTAQQYTHKEETKTNETDMIHKSYMNTNAPNIEGDKRHESQKSINEVPDSICSQSLPIIRDWDEEKESQMITHGFIHEIENHHSFWHRIPESIFHLCFLFYYEAFLDLDIDRYKAGPFQILLAVFGCQYALSMGCWGAFSIHIQAQQLQPTNIATDSAREGVANVLAQNVYASLPDSSLSLIHKHIMRVLSRYCYEMKAIKVKPIAGWSLRDIMVSIISYVIEKSVSDDSENKRYTLHPKIWEFIAYWRRLWYEEAYDGKYLLNLLQSQQFIALHTLKSVCRKYQLKSGPFYKAKKQVKNWYKFYRNRVIQTAHKEEAKSVKSEMVQRRDMYTNETNIDFDDLYEHLNDDIPPQISTHSDSDHANQAQNVLHEAPIAYGDSGTHTHSIQTFCTLTNATKDIALLFLQETAWNMNVAVDRFFRFNGNVTSLNENNTNDQEGRFIQSNALQSNDVTKKHVTHSMIVKSYFDNECDWEEDEESKMIVDGFIHRIEHHYSFCYHIPQTIFHLCFLFYYDDTFLNSGVDLYYVGPFQILFAEFRYQSALSMGNWDIDAFSINMQAEQLQLANISTDSARKEVANVLVQNVYATLIDPTSLLLINKEIMRMLSRYLHEIQTIQLKPIARWSQRDIMLSIISYVIETSASDDSKNKRNTLQPRIWEFMLHLRRYFYEEAYDGKHLFDVPVWKDENKPKKGFGLQMMKMVCSKYQLKSGPFSKAKKIIHFWHISLETQTNALTPFHTLFSIFECQYGSLSVFMGSVDTQVHLLQLSNIATESQRERVANDIIHNMDLLDSTTLIQINEEILRMLSSYVRETQAMRHKPTALWSHRDVVLSFISCIIDGLENKSDSLQSIALWKFVEYLRRYCYDQTYNGQKLVNDFNTLNQQTSQQSIGLKLLDDVCAKYEIKSEQFTKIQMEIMFWSSKFNCHSSPFKILCAEFEHMYTYTFTFTPYIDTQAQLLKFSNIVSDCGFKHAIGALNDHMQIHDINDVQDTLKIHEETVRILSRYVGDMLSVKHKPIASWSRHDTIISLISYLIDASVHDDSCWLFVEYFRRYCHERPYDGIDVLNDLNPTRLHTATLISNVCSKYDIKQEKFHTMKDHIILWMKEVYEQHETGDAWLWFNADPDVLCWLAHSKSDTKKLNTAWQNGSKSCLVSNDRGRVEFDRSNPTQPSGNQFCHGTETSRYGEASEEAPNDAFQYSVPVAYNINWSNVYPLSSDEQSNDIDVSQLSFPAT